MTDFATDNSLETRRRLLDSAGEVFAEKGFANSTVREICKKAGANIAAVNYHFGDKQKLYLAVFADCRSHADRGPAPSPKLSPEQRLREFIRQFLRHLL